MENKKKDRKVQRENRAQKRKNVKGKMNSRVPKGPSSQRMNGNGPRGKFQKPERRGPRDQGPRPDRRGPRDQGFRPDHKGPRDQGSRPDRRGPRDQNQPMSNRKPKVHFQKTETEDSPDETVETGEMEREAKKEKIEKIAKTDRKEQREKKKFDFERNNRTIFVGNLPSSLDHKDVAKLFKQCGPVESARIRSVIPEKEKLPPKVAQITGRIHPKVDSVNAYVVFDKTDDVDGTIKKALAMNGQLINEHHIRVDIAQHPNSKRMTLTSRKKSVFVGNLRFDIRDDDLINHFEKVGKVDYVRLVRDRATGLGKGFGFVKFDERASVKEALKLNDTQFKGRALRLKKVD